MRSTITSTAAGKILSFFFALVLVSLIAQVAYVGAIATPAADAQGAQRLVGNPDPPASLKGKFGTPCEECKKLYRRNPEKCAIFCKSR